MSMLQLLLAKIKLKGTVIIETSLINSTVQLHVRIENLIIYISVTMKRQAHSRQTKTHSKAVLKESCFWNKSH